MQRFHNLDLIGTSHISEESIREIEREFHAWNPTIVAVELDRGRLQSLLENAKPSYSPALIREVGVTGYLFVLIGGLIQRKLGNLVGVIPGSEMKSAVLLAKDNQRKVALIDQDVRVTLRRFSKLFGFKEKFRIFIDLFRGPFIKDLQFDIRKVPSKQAIKRLIGFTKNRYPGFYAALIGERNEYMARKLVHLMKRDENERILAVVGAGHEEEMMSIIRKKYHLIEKIG
ncbi:TraB/GumN family protein [Candidatus Woesearchaeota archaeon]|nr:TraB/GumN family protein [Candidatus Woesearchaeota archaeon]